MNFGTVLEDSQTDHLIYLTYPDINLSINYEDN